MSTPAIESFKTILEQTPVGPIDKDSVLGKAIIPALAAAWMDFPGSDAADTYPYKVEDRAEQLICDPPNFVFVTARHRPTVRGSIYADLHEWTVNLTYDTAKVSYLRKRQVNPRSNSVTKKDMQIIAGSIADKIEANITDPCITWLKSKPVVTVSVKEVFPSVGNSKRTTESRRSKFWFFLITEMRNRGWEYVQIGSRVGFTR